MGCGGSKLKGDGPDDVGTAPRPVRDVLSNFKDVDYNTGADPRKGSTAGNRAPHEIDPPKAQKEAEDNGMTATAQKDEDAKLEPYKSISDPDQAGQLASSEETPDTIR